MSHNIDMQLSTGEVVGEVLEVFSSFDHYVRFYLHILFIFTSGLALPSEPDRQQTHS